MKKRFFLLLTWRFVFWKSHAKSITFLFCFPNITFWAAFPVGQPFIWRFISCVCTIVSYTTSLEVCCGCSCVAKSAGTAVWAASGVAESSAYWRQLCEMRPEDNVPWRWGGSKTQRRRFELVGALSPVKYTWWDQGWQRRWRRRTTNTGKTQLKRRRGGKTQLLFVCETVVEGISYFQ